MDEVLFYNIYDVGCTLVECIYMLLLLCLFTGEKFRSKNNLAMAVLEAVITVGATYFISDIAIKAVFLAFGNGIIWSIIKKQKILQGVAISGLSLGLICSIQTLVLLIISFFWNDPAFDMGTFFIANWQWSIIMHVACLSISVIMYWLLRNFHFEWETKDLLLAGITGLTEILVGASSTEKLFREGVEEKGGMFFSACLLWVIVFLIVQFQQTSHLRIKEAKERLRLQSLESEVTYFRSKAKEEQRVRRLYHDMKNLMLAVKLSKEDSMLLDSVEEDLEEYGQYYESGNAILNVILKEKIKAAKDKDIDLQVDVDFTEGGFMEDRDIVTIFGNALDNAMEASQKLSAEERMITVKARKARNMLFIVFENNMAEDWNPDLHTTKKDEFLHGFGIVNMKESVERYDGSCVIDTEKKRFLVRILIPIP